ncbi:MAG: hypothetical protein H6767_04920 [Candidatus Peribacteria bacterium]|nr:MAG: hypothetical protein H6767_04920 [Candidatus Peribacteria bacterium]
MPEKVIETKTCKHCSVNFDITDKDVEFYEKVSPSFGGKKYLIPSPTLCPDCRQQRRLSFRNERTLYKRNCDATGKPMISMYNPEVPYTIYHPEFWWSDQWSAFSYGKTIDFECSVFQQIDTLYHTVPLYSLGVSYMTMQNSDYNNMAGYLKDCYMLTNSDDDDSCLYGKGVNRCASCVDNLKIYDSERLYECMSCYNCNDCKYLMNSEGCYQCEVSMNLLNCKFCFGCYNLSGKEYYLFNESLTPEEWKNRVQLICAEKSYVDIQKQLLSTSRIVKEKQIDRNEDSSGDYMYETFHCASCYDVEKMQDSKYCFDLKRGERISDENYDISQF